MDPSDTERLQRNWKDLLEVNSDDIMPDLIQDLIFDTDAMEEISHQGTRKKKTEMMLMKLTKQGPSAYPSFRKALQKFDVYNHLVQKLDMTQCGDLLVTQPSGDEPDMWPSRPGTLRADPGPSTPAPQKLPQVARTPFTDLECLNLAKLLDQERDFPRIGLRLNFPDPTLSRYRRENSGGSSNGTYKMLVDWKKQYLDYEHREHLSLALDNAGLKTLASRVRYGRKLESVSSPSPSELTSASYGASYSAMYQSSLPNMPSTSGFSPPIDPPGSLHAPVSSPTGFGPGIGPITRLPRHTHPSHGNDVTDVDLFNLSRHLNFECYQRLGLSLGYTLNQLDAFETKNCCDIQRTALDMLTNLKSHVGHIRKAEFKEFLDSQAQLPTLVHLLPVTRIFTGGFEICKSGPKGLGEASGVSESTESSTSAGVDIPPPIATLQGAYYQHDQRHYRTDLETNLDDTQETFNHFNAESVQQSGVIRLDKHQIEIQIPPGDDSFLFTSVTNGNLRCDVRGRDLDLYLDHFSEWWIIALITSVFLGKRLICTPHVPISTKMYDEHLVVLCIRDDNAGKEEVEPEYIAPVKGAGFSLNWFAGPLTVTCKADTKDLGGKEVETSVFHQYIEENIQFLVKTSGITKSRIFVEFTMEQKTMKSILCPMNLSATWNPHGSTSVCREAVSNDSLNMLAIYVPIASYYVLSEKLGIEHNPAKNLLIKNGNDSTSAIRECLGTWKNRTGGSLVELRQILMSSELGGLVQYVK